MWPKRVLLFTLVLLACSTALYTYTKLHTTSLAKLSTKSPVEILQQPIDVFKIQQPKKPESFLEASYKEDKVISLLLIGLDRRSKDELGYRTDIMILLTINPVTNKVVLVSVPRDYYYKGERINAVFSSQGWEGLQEAMLSITNIKPQRYISADFEDFSWIVDAMGGIPVTVQTAFTDNEYPNDLTKEYQTISFIEGPTVLDGKNALIYARSRHGNNNEGSDWARQKRQHQMLKSMITAVLQPKSIFNPMVVEKAFETVTTGHMTTNLQIADAQYLWDYYKDKDKYSVISMYLDMNYLYNPPMEDYGGAWVLTTTPESLQRFQNEMVTALGN